MFSIKRTQAKAFTLTTTYYYSKKKHVDAYEKLTFFLGKAPIKKNQHKIRTCPQSSDP